MDLVGDDERGIVAQHGRARGRGDARRGGGRGEGSGWEPFGTYLGPAGRDAGARVALRGGRSVQLARERPLGCGWRRERLDPIAGAMGVAGVSVFELALECGDGPLELVDRGSVLDLEEESRCPLELALGNLGRTLAARDGGDGPGVAQSTLEALAEHGGEAAGATVDRGARHEGGLYAGQLGNPEDGDLVAVCAGSAGPAEGGAARLGDGAGLRCAWGDGSWWLRRASSSRRHGDSEEPADTPRARRPGEALARLLGMGDTSVCRADVSCPLGRLFHSALMPVVGGGFSAGARPDRRARPYAPAARRRPPRRAAARRWPRETPTGRWR